jgi:MATE family multidrug resistance protein
MTAPQDRETLVVSSRPLKPGGMNEVLRLSIPGMAASASTVVMSLTNSVMVAGVATGAVGAVTGSAIMFHVLTAVCGGLLSAIVPFTSQSYSRGDRQDGARYTWQGLYAAVAMGLGAMVLVPWLPQLFALIGHTGDVQAMEVAYTQYRLPSLLFFLVAGAIYSFLQGIGRTKLIMVVVGVSNLLNIVLNYLFIYGVGPFPKMGVAGAGLGTLIAQGVGCAWFLAVFLWGRAAHENASRRTLALSWSHIKGLVRVGLPTGCQWSLDVLTWAIFHALMVGRLGAREYDANGAVLEITQIAWMPLMGLGSAAASLTGWYLGKGKPDIARRTVRHALAISTAYMAVTAAIMYFFARELMEAFFVLQKTGPESGADLAKVIGLGIVALRIASAFQIFDGTNLTLMGALRGGGDTLWPAVVQQILAWFLFLPLAWYLCFRTDLGMAGAWWACAVYLTLLAGFMYARYRGTAWMKKNIFKDREKAAAAAP